MPCLSISQTEHQKKMSVGQNQDLRRHIWKHNNKQTLRKISQIIRFGDELVIAIRNFVDVELLPNGCVGTIYTAHPVKKNGSINTKIELMVKIIKNSAVAGNEDQPKDYMRTKTETENDNYIYSSRMTIIPRQQTENGQTIYDTAIVMSKVPGIPLNIAIQKYYLKKLSPQQRLYLSINTISFFNTMHQNHIFQGDLKAENFLVNLEALLGTAVDIDPSHTTEEIQAPEAEITALSDTYSVALDILTPILSDIRPLKKDPKIWGRFLIQQLYSYFRGYHYDIYDVLVGMQHPDPQQRITLAQAQITLETILEKVAKESVVTEKILKAQHHHYQQLRSLETILDDPDYKPFPLYQISNSEDIPAQPLSAKKCSFFSSVPSAPLTPVHSLSSPQP